MLNIVDIYEMNNKYNIHDRMGVLEGLQVIYI